MLVGITVYRLLCFPDLLAQDSLILLAMVFLKLFHKVKINKLKFEITKVTKGSL